MVLKYEFYMHPPNSGQVQNKSQSIDWEPTIFITFTYFRVLMEAI